jgi:hypothetical protein
MHDTTLFPGWSLTSQQIFAFFANTCGVSSFGENFNAMGMQGGVSGVKGPEREADYSVSTSAEVRNTRIYTSTPACIFMA